MAGCSGYTDTQCQLAPAGLLALRSSAGRQLLFAALLFGGLLTGTSTRSLDPNIFPPQLAGNLALIAFSRMHGREDGQIFAISVMAVAASEVVVGLGLIVALNRKRVTLDVDRLNRLRG